MSTDETALESNAETEGTSDLSSGETESHTGQQQGLQQGPQAQQGSDADASAATADQQVDRPILSTVFIRLSAQGAYLSFGLSGWALIRGGCLFEVGRLLSFHHFQ